MQRLPLSLGGLLIWCALATLAFVAVRPIARGALPLVETTVNLIQRDYVGSVTLEPTRAGPSILMTCSALHELRLRSGKTIPYLGTFGCARTDAIHSLVPLAIYLLFILAWPVVARREILGRALASVMLLPLVIALSTPVLLVGLVHAELYPESFRADAQFTALMQPFVFMELGGNWLMPTLAGLIGVWLGKRRVDAHRDAGLLNPGA